MSKRTPKRNAKTGQFVKSRKEPQAGVPWFMTPAKPYKKTKPEKVTINRVTDQQADTFQNIVGRWLQKPKKAKAKTKAKAETKGDNE